MSSKITRHGVKSKNFGLMIDKMEENLKDYPVNSSPPKSKTVKAITPVSDSQASDYIVPHIDIQEHYKNSQLLYARPNP